MYPCIHIHSGSDKDHALVNSSSQPTVCIITSSEVLAVVGHVQQARVVVVASVIVVDMGVPVLVVDLYTSEE